MAGVEESGRITPAVWLALGVVYLVWGSTYLAIRVAVRTAPPLVAAGLRFTFAGLLLGALIAARRGPRALRVTRRQLAGCALLGLLLPVGGNGLVTLAERDVPSGLAALVIAVIPLYVVLLRAGTGDRARLATWLGVLVGFGGIAVLADPGGGAKPLGLTLLLLAALMWSIGSFIQGRIELPADPFVITVWEMASGGVVMLVIGLARGELATHPLSGVSAESWWAIAYLMVFGSIVAFSAYVWVLSVAPISLVATYAYVNPAVAVLLGWLILDERLTARLVVGGVLVVVAVAVVIAAEARARREAAVTPTPEPVVGESVSDAD